MIAVAAGFSLVEVMVALTLGVFLTLGVIKIVSVSKGIYLSNAAIARMQENGRYALGIVTRNIRMAGFTGCSREQPITNLLNNSSTVWWENFATSATAASGVSIRGYDGTQDFPSTDCLPDVQFTTVTGGKRIGATDALIALGGDGGYPVKVNGSTSLILSSITKPSGATLKPYDLLIACDTSNVSLFQATSVSTTAPNYTVGHTRLTTTCSGQTCPPGQTCPGNSDATLSVSSSAPAAQIGLRDYIPTAFYIGNSATCGTGACALPHSLYQLQFILGAMVAQEVTEGVQDMQIFYGEDDPIVNDPLGTGLPDGVVDIYRDATSVVNWNNVLAVRISLLMATLEDNIVPQPQSYQWPADTGDAAKFGRTSTATDRRYYQVFATTVGIRNRLTGG